ncbi:MAG: GTP-binding protein [Candidatus Lokiarchaeota archaeon]|nr:GTP-binding protein [Candidatus Lokiarchaeota archaeon]
MSINKNQLFGELLEEFLQIHPKVEAVIVSDQDGFIIAGKKRKDIDMELVSFLTAVVNPIIERIRNEFSFKKFGTASFDTDDHRLLFVSIDEATTLSLVIESLGSIDKVAPYAYFLAEKTAQILSAKEGDLIQINIPDFEYEAKWEKKGEKLKNQIYQSSVELGGAYRFKFIIIGDHEVGKTSIIRRFVEKKFYADYRTTIGLNIISHSFRAFENDFSISLWDIGAQEYFKRYRKTYYKGAQAAFIVFDLTNKQSFDNIHNWYNELMEFSENRELPIVLVGNKSDLEEQRVIASDEAKNAAQTLSDLTKFSTSSKLSSYSDLSGVYEASDSKISYIETSALTGENIEDAFKLISYHFMTKSKELEEESLKTKILEQIKSILRETKSLTLSFITKDMLWSPGLQILTELDDLGKISKVKEKKKKKAYIYSNGLKLDNFSYNYFKVSDSDGVFCIFDAREKDHIEPIWREYLIDIIESVEKNKVVLIGMRVSEKIDWSVLMEEFDINVIAEEKMVSVLFFKIGEDYRIEIYEQLDTMLNMINNLLFSY